MFKVNNKYTKKTSPDSLFSYKVAGLSPVTLFKKRPGDAVLMFSLLTLNIFHTFFYCFYR